MLFNEEMPTNGSFYRTQRYRDTEFLIATSAKVLLCVPMSLYPLPSLIGRTNKPFGHLRYKGRQAGR